MTLTMTNGLGTLKPGCL